MSISRVRPDAMQQAFEKEMMQLDEMNRLKRHVMSKGTIAEQDNKTRSDWVPLNVAICMRKKEREMLTKARQNARNIIFQDLKKNVDASDRLFCEGRKIYLKDRKNILPENKFNYPVLTSMDYGWQLGDHIDHLLPPLLNARVASMRQSFFRRNGLPYFAHQTTRCEDAH